MAQYSATGEEGILSIVSYENKYKNDLPELNKNYKLMKQIEKGFIILEYLKMLKQYINDYNIPETKIKILLPPSNIWEKTKETENKKENLYLKNNHNYDFRMLNKRFIRSENLKLESILEQLDGLIKVAIASIGIRNNSSRNNTNPPTTYTTPNPPEKVPSKPKQTSRKNNWWDNNRGIKQEDIFLWVIDQDGSHDIKEIDEGFVSTNNSDEYVEIFYSKSIKQGIGGSQVDHTIRKYSGIQKKLNGKIRTGDNSVVLEIETILNKIIDDLNRKVKTLKNACEKSRIVTTINHKLQEGFTDNSKKIIINVILNSVEQHKKDAINSNIIKKNSKDGKYMNILNYKTLKSIDEICEKSFNVQKLDNFNNITSDYNKYTWVNIGNEPHKLLYKG